METDPDPENCFVGRRRNAGRFVHELAHGTKGARRIVVHVVRSSIPSDEVARETRLAAQGYPLSVAKTAVRHLPPGHASFFRPATHFELGRQPLVACRDLQTWRAIWIVLWQSSSFLAPGLGPLTVDHRIPPIGHLLGCLRFA